MLFKDISYLQLWRPFCSVEGNHLCNFGRGYQVEQFCEIILLLDQWFRRRFCSNYFLSRALGGPRVQLSRTIYAILKEDIMGNIHVKLYELLTCGSGGCRLKIFLILSSGDPVLSLAKLFVHCW